MKKVERTDEARHKRIVASLKRGDKYGKANTWNALKANEAARRYQAQMKKLGKKPYKTARPTKASNSLMKWNSEKWRTKSGKPSLKTGERFLPSAAIKNLSSKEYAATSRKKRADMKKGKQFSKQPKKIALKTSKYRA